MSRRRRNRRSARLFLSAAARHISDFAAAVVPDSSDDLAAAGDYIVIARRARLQVAVLMFAAICFELEALQAQGVDVEEAWRRVAVFAGYETNQDWFQDQYRDAYDLWAAGHGNGDGWHPEWVTAVGPGFDLTDETRLAAHLQRWARARAPRSPSVMQQRPS